MSGKRIEWRAWFLAGLVGLAGLVMLHPARAEDDFLDPEVAFKGSVRALDAKTVEVTFDIAPGYYLYREQFKLAATGATLGAPRFPPGKVKFDETFQKNVETHRGLMHIAVPVDDAKGPFRLAVNYQGCADKGLCYPPAQMRADVRLAGFGGDGSVSVQAGRDMPLPGASTETTANASASPAPGGLSAIGGSKASSPDSSTPAVNTATSTPSDNRASADDEGATDALLSGGFWKIVGVFFLAGIGLSLTPCVLPMVPILSSIIVGQGAVTASRRSRAFALSISYVLGMSLVYTAFGVAAGLAGTGLAAYLQNPWVLGTFGVLLVVLSLSMFGVYELQLPIGMTSPLTNASHRLPGGTFGGVFAMGGVSALIVSPCVAAPLAGALLFISRTHDVWLGATGLFALSIGMGIPLLAVGASAGALLPRAGAWMETVKRVSGVVLLGVAVYIVQPVIPATLALLMWGLLLVGTAVMLVTTAAPPDGGAGAWVRGFAAAVTGLIGAIQIVGATSGGTDPLHPLAHLHAPAGGGQAASSGSANGTGRNSTASASVVFQPVRSVADLDAALVQAKQVGRPVMLDFYADWCVSCKEMEHLTFSEPSVQAKLVNAVLLQADVTKNNANDRELLKRFQLFGPPGTIFFDAQGKELVQPRVIGFQNTERFLETLRAAGV